MSMQGSAMMYVIGSRSCYSERPRKLLLASQLRDEGLATLGQRRFREHLVEAGLVGPPEPGGVGVVREADGRHVGIGLGHVVRVAPRNVRDDHVGRVDAVRRRQVMSRKKALELAAKVEVDSRQQDRRHRAERNTLVRSPKAQQ